MTAATSYDGVRSSLESERRERWSAAAVYVIGAVCYFVAREFLELPFTASPLFVGVVMLAASRVRRRLLASAVLLLTWGAAILINGRGPFEAGRTAALYIAAFGLGSGILLVPV